MIQIGSRKISLVKTIDQLRAARGLLGWSQSELAARAGLSLPTVERLKGGLGRGYPMMLKSSCKKQLKPRELNSSMKTGVVSAFDFEAT